jgi:hypothetical protein
MIRKQLMCLLFAATTLIGFNSCQKIRDLKTFDIDFSTSFDIPSSNIFGGLVQTPPQRIETNSSSSFEDQGTKAKWVKTVYLKNMKGTITNPDNEDFNFLERIEVYIDAEGVDEVLMAFNYNVPEDVNSISLTPTNCDLKAFLLKDAIQIRTVSTASNSRAVTVKADLTFEVEAQLKLFK